VLLSVPFAAYLLALSDADPAAWAKPLIVAGYVVGPYVIGALAGWRGLPIFAGVFFATSILYQAFLWRDHPAFSGIDDIPPIAGIVLVVPFMLVPMALGAASRRLWVRMQGRGAQRG
jgi:hypothetical protein